MASSNLVALAASLKEALASPQSLVATTKEEEDACLDIIDMLPDLKRVLVGEFQNLWDLSWGYMSTLSLNFISHFKIPSLVPLSSSISYTSLSEKSGLHIVPLKQLLRHAITNRIFCEPTPSHIAHTSSSRLLVENEKAAALVSYMTDTLKLAAAHEVEALERWKGSRDPRETGLSIGLGEPGTVGIYEDLARHPWKKERFGNVMQVLTTGEGFKIETLVEGYDWGALGEGTVVDVGGSNGHVSFTLAEAYPSLSLIVQDISLPSPLPPPHPRVEFMQHDFFTPQPVKNADVYLYRWIFHNWDDEKSISILRNLIPALKKGAKILVNDGCLPVPGTGRRSEEQMARLVDLAMLLTMNAKEREEDDWRSLFERADSRFRYLGARKPERSQMWIIEAVWEGDS